MNPIITYLPSPNFYERDGHKITGVVLHITEGSFDSAKNWFLDPASQVSAHYIVGNDRILNMVPESRGAWHAGRVSPDAYWKGLIPGVNPNKYTIGIEVALNSASEFPGWPQWKDAAWLLADICRRNNIPLNEIGVAHHHEIFTGKTCPGWWITRFYFFNFIKYFRY